MKTSSYSSLYERSRRRARRRERIEAGIEITLILVIVAFFLFVAPHATTPEALRHSFLY